MSCLRDKKNDTCTYLAHRLQPPLIVQRETPPLIVQRETNVPRETFLTHRRFPSL